MRRRGKGPDVGLIIEHDTLGGLVDLREFGTRALGIRWRPTWNQDLRAARVWPSPHAVESAMVLIPRHQRLSCRVLRYRSRGRFRQPEVEEVA